MQTSTAPTPSHVRPSNPTTLQSLAQRPLLATCLGPLRIETTQVLVTFSLLTGFGPAGFSLAVHGALCTTTQTTTSTSARAGSPLTRGSSSCRHRRLGPMRPRQRSGHARRCGAKPSQQQALVHLLRKPLIFVVRSWKREWCRPNKGTLETEYSPDPFVCAVLCVRLSVVSCWSCARRWRR